MKDAPLYWDLWEGALQRADFDETAIYSYFLWIAKAAVPQEKKPITQYLC